MRLRVRSHWRAPLAVAAACAFVVIGATAWMLLAAYRNGLLTGRPAFDLNDASAADYAAPQPRTRTPERSRQPDPAPLPPREAPGGVWLPEQGVAAGDAPRHADLTRPR